MIIDFFFKSLHTCPMILKEEFQTFQQSVNKQLQCDPLIFEVALQFKTLILNMAF